MNNMDNIKEKLYTKTLKDGLKVYIYKKIGFSEKIALFGTKYGSINNHFNDINTDQEIIVPDGVAHFLEHKLFEQEGANALDLFSKIGVSANAYTSFDQTVFYFETIQRFNESLALLIKLVKTPYFTDKNVEKEQGIIGQEINMYNDDSGYMAYFNALKAMYIKNPVNIDIAGSIESISKINKDVLYSCYNTFYYPSNMFLIVIGDVDIDDTINCIEQNLRLYEHDYDRISEVKNVKKYFVEEPKNINKKYSDNKMEVYMPELCIGYKLDVVQKEEIIKNEVISQIISEMYFSKLSNFYKTEYENKVISSEIEFDGEFTNSFAHVIISASTTNVDKLKEDILEYIEKIKVEDVDNNLFELVKRRLIGADILDFDDLNSIYRRIIDSILTETDLYEPEKILNALTSKDIKRFLNNLKSEKQVVSIIRPE